MKCVLMKSFRQKVGFWFHAQGALLFSFPMEIYFSILGNLLKKNKNEIETRKIFSNFGIFGITIVLLILNLAASKRNFVKDKN